MGDGVTTGGTRNNIGNSRRSDTKGSGDSAHAEESPPDPPGDHGMTRGQDAGRLAGHFLATDGYPAFGLVERRQHEILPTAPLHRGGGARGEGNSGNERRESVCDTGAEVTTGGGKGWGKGIEDGPWPSCSPTRTRRRAGAAGCSACCC